MSTAGILGTIGQINYGSAKAGLIALTADGLVRAAMRASKDPLGTFLAITGRKQKED